MPSWQPSSNATRRRSRPTTPANGRRCCSPASTTIARRSCRSAPAPAGPRRPTGPRCSCGCTCAGRSATASRPRSSTSRKASRRASRASPSRSTAGAPTAGCAPNVASIGSSGSARSTRRTGARRRSPSSRCCPEADEDVEIELDWDQIRVDTFRSQGAGGQHVNKTDSAVRLTHLPTGIVAQSQNERSQTQNKEMAIKVLKARILEQALEEKEAEVRKLKGEHVEAGWGNQIRSYVLHPYQMVKDLRTGHETGNTSAVLDGDLDAFMQAELERAARRRGRRVVSVPGTGRRARAGELTYRPRPRPTRSRPAPGSGGSRSTTTSTASTRPRSRPSSTRSSACSRHLQSTDPERFVVATERDGQRLGRRSRRRVCLAVSRERLWYLSMLFVLPEHQGAGVGRELLDRVLPADPDVARRPPPTAPSPSRTRCTPRSGSPRGCRCSTCRGCPSGPRPSGAALRGRAGRLRHDRGRSAGRSGPPRARRRRSTRWTASVLGASIARITGSCDRRAGRAGSITARRRAARLRLRRREPGDSGPVAVRDEALLAPILGHLDLGGRPARRLRHLDRRRGAIGGRGRPGRRLSARSLPCPRLLGSPVRRLRPLPPDQPGAALTNGARTSSRVNRGSGGRSLGRPRSRLPLD